MNELSGEGVSDWVELFNLTRSTVDLGGYQLVPGAPAAPITFSPGTTIGPLGYRVVEFGDVSVLSASLYDASGALVDGFGIGRPTANVHRCPNGHGDWTNSITTTKGAANSCP